MDLADLADGLLDAARRDQLEEHLADCLLCRVKLRRLRDAGANSEAPEAPLLRRALENVEVATPAFYIPEPLGASGDVPEPGEVWAAGSEERVLVLVISSIEDARVIVAPVSFDVDTADDETIIVASDQTALRLPLALYPTLRTDVPVSALRSGYGALVAPGEVERLVRGESAGASRGTPITGPTDPRLELRQYLADRLGDLDEILADPDTTSDAPPPRPEQIASKLSSDLRAWRGSACRVEPVTSWDRAPVATAMGWTPLLSVDEVGVLLVVFDTPRGLADDEDFDAGRSVLTRFNATALVVLASALSSFADVFSATDLHDAIGVPSGERKPPRPSVSTLPPFDAVMKFLDQNSGWMAPPWPARATVSRVDVTAILRSEAEASLADVVSQGRRAHIKAKAAGYTSIESLRADFERALLRSLSGEVITDALSDLSEADL
jgi:hypothetical protein